MVSNIRDSVRGTVDFRSIGMTEIPYLDDSSVHVTETATSPLPPFFDPDVMRPDFMPIPEVVIESPKTKTAIVALAILAGVMLLS